MKNVVIDGVEYVEKKKIVEAEGLRYVIVRCRNAGVYAGFLKKRNRDTLTLVNSRRLWYWWSKFTLYGLAMCGVLKSKVDEVKFACEVPEIELTCSDVCEVIPCTYEAMQSIRQIKEHKND